MCVCVNSTVRVYVIIGKCVCIDFNVHETVTVYMYTNMQFWYSY